MPGRPRGTIGDQLTTRRRKHFVGRRGEVDLFRSALDEDDFSLLHVSGPGGVGKSTLLDALADVAWEAGCTVVRLDGHDLPATPPGVLDALAGPLDVPSVPDGPIVPTADSRVVLLVDGYELLDGLDAWFRERLLPRMPDATVTVLVGRTPARSEWRTDPAWSERTRVITLRNLASEDVRTLLLARGVSSDRHAAVTALTHGHPLALSLVVDVLARDPGFELADLPHDLVRTLLERLVTTVPDAAHRHGLEVSAIARVTSEELLRHVLAEPASAAAVFAWLEGLSVVDDHRDGLAAHDLLRDVLDADLRRRDPESYRRTFRAVQDHTLEQVRATTGREQLRAIADLKFCFRRLRSVVAPVAWGEWGEHHPDRARIGDHAAITGLVRTAEGEESAALVEHWLDRQPDAFHVIRGPETSPRGVIAILDLTAATPDERDVDPGTRLVWSHLQQTAPPRPGERVTQCRFVVDADCYQRPSPTMNAVPVLTLQHQLATPHLAWDFLTLAAPDQWEEFLAMADQTRAPATDFDLGGRRFGSFGHDFRAVPVASMIRRWTERALADDSFLVPDEPEPELVVLAHPDFSAAVRQGLRDLHRRDLLARNPLLRTRLVAGEDGPADAERLGALIRAAVLALAEDPRDDKLFRAVDRTHVQRARTQEAAAAALGLPFSTYRRHLAAGLDRVVEWLWRRELGNEQE